MAEYDEMTKQELYRECKKAINAILVGGQSYKIGSRTLTRANITELKNLMAELENEIAAESQSSPLMDRTSVAFFDGR